MSNDSVTAPKHPTVSAAERADMAMLLARSVRQRREQLGLSVQRAAELSGMVVSDWYALEAGWVPDDESAAEGDRRSPGDRLPEPVVHRRDQPLQPGNPV